MLQRKVQHPTYIRGAERGSNVRDDLDSDSGFYVGGWPWRTAQAASRVRPSQAASGGVSGLAAFCR